MCRDQRMWIEKKKNTNNSTDLLLRSLSSNVPIGAPEPKPAQL
jgi:hypothetical protein